MDAVTKNPFNYLESSLKFTCFTSDFELKCALSLNVILVIRFAFFFGTTFVSRWMDRWTWLGGHVTGHLPMTWRQSPFLEGWKEESEGKNNRRHHVYWPIGIDHVTSFFSDDKRPISRNWIDWNVIQVGWNSIQFPVTWPQSQQPCRLANQNGSRDLNPTSVDNYLSWKWSFQMN